MVGTSNLGSWNGHWCNFSPFQIFHQSDAPDPWLSQDRLGHLGMAAPRGNGEFTKASRRGGH
jgi:hypothetical protein